MLEDIPTFMSLNLCLKRLWEELYLICVSMETLKEEVHASNDYIFPRVTGFHQYISFSIL